jgi:opacity protein-like surface antigen
MRDLLVALTGALLCAAPAAGQTPASQSDTTGARVPRWHIGIGAEFGQPLGAFKRNVRHAAGAQGVGLLRLDHSGRTSLRLQAGWLNYGHESQRNCLGTAPNCRVAVDITTANGILSLAMGPQFSVPLGRVRTYGYGLIGMSRFATVSGLGGGLVPDLLAADENFGDGGLAWSGGIGVQLPVRRSTSVDLGVRYEHHGKRDYVLAGGVTDQPDGSLTFDVKRSNAALFALRVGLTTALGRTRRAAPTP